MCISIFNRIHLIFLDNAVQRFRHSAPSAGTAPCRRYAPCAQPDAPSRVDYRDIPPANLSLMTDLLDRTLLRKVY